MIHQRQGLPLRLEAGDDLGRIHARLDDLEGDHSPDRLLLLGHVDHAEAAFADLLQQLVRPNDAANPFGRRVANDGRREHLGSVLRLRRIVHEKSLSHRARLAVITFILRPRPARRKRIAPLKRWATIARPVGDF